MHARILDSCGKAADANRFKPTENLAVSLQAIPPFRIPHGKLEKSLLVTIERPRPGEVADHWGDRGSRPVESLVIMALERASA
jgi:hypothetical protein